MKKMMKKIFSLLRVDSTFMTTSYNRMIDVNLILRKYIKKIFLKKLQYVTLLFLQGNQH